MRWQEIYCCQSPKWAMEWLGVDKADCLYVGDRPEDEQAAQNAGVNFLWAADWWLSI